MRYRFLTIDSAAIAGNLLGDGAQRDVVVYESRRRDGDDRPPRLVVLLHGLPGHAMNWIAPDHLHASGTIRPALAPLLDEVFEDPAVPPAVIAMPDGRTRWGGGQWLDSPVNGDLSRHVVEEVVPLVEREFGTDPDPATRVVTGHSSGGAGAWELATATDAFGSLGFTAGDALFEHTQLPKLAKVLAGHPDLLSCRIEEVPRGATELLAMAASYSPDPARRPLPVRLPFDPVTGETIEEVWALWRAKDPVVNAADRAGRLRRLRRVVLDVGDRDEYAAQFGQRALAARLRAIGIPHTETEFAGTHSSHTHQRTALVISQLLRDDWADGWTPEPGR